MITNSIKCDLSSILLPLSEQHEAYLTLYFMFIHIWYLWKCIEIMIFGWNSIEHNDDTMLLLILRLLSVIFIKCLKQLVHWIIQIHNGNAILFGFFTKTELSLRSTYFLGEPNLNLSVFLCNFHANVVFNNGARYF